MKYLRLLLFPFSLLYGLVVSIRNWCYDAGLFKSYTFKLPVISVGNLDVGGAGKSPMTEYLIRLLKDQYKIATLSRGYGRETKGFIQADNTSTATQIGDEPAQFKHKFPDVTVAVCEDRVTGIKQLVNYHEVIILDDAYQHRKVKPGFSILLFDYTRLNEPRLVLPAGNLREPFIGRWRADVIVISKCPANLSTDEQTAIAEKIKPFPFQQLFFTSIAYQPLRTMSGNNSQVAIDNNTTVFLLTGIANTFPLLQYLQGFTTKIIHHKYPDHHPFSLKNITKLAAEFEACPAEKKLLITTEKDAQRLGEQHLLPLVSKLPFLVLPIGVEFLNNGQLQFNDLILQYVREHTAHRGIH
ncbi:tetraacyldisaccharide 4'-kinase [Mucilaginibacter limnophilus]|uniref:Tetraacyldisaccharide 4'-kinase n=1 Tax=Mucilaginibacter limnophilus TaxID=1932778 RepID=A0A3S2Y4Q0_9SPHI|nr:tetraacyldisaccharide 4'-kinase [Mucilaginibacter limnophilus]RVU01966.1 tetraacyldisaccharide 4'-kinase [Mucilaginibacter limnophilus]